MSIALKTSAQDEKVFGPIGCHCSISGGVYNALYEGRSLGASTAQIFTSNQRRWESRLFTPSEIQKWEEVKAETGLHTIMSHASYLLNLGSPKEESRQKSLAALQLEIQRCQQLDLAFLNFHPGAALDSTIEECLDHIVASLLSVQDLFSSPLAEKSKLRLLLEATAGQGSTVGNRFEHLAYIISKVKDHIPIGVCIDTCHIFVAGYDLRTLDACKNTLDLFDQVVGIEHLYALHLNDSMKPFNSAADRHSCLGQGEIGLEAFKFLATDSRTAPLPKYLETPERNAIWAQEIALMRRFAKEAGYTIFL
jgi:deoxyribonuclease-4